MDCEEAFSQGIIFPPDSASKVDEESVSVRCMSHSTEISYAVVRYLRCHEMIQCRSISRLWLEAVDQEFAIRLCEPQYEYLTYLESRNKYLHSPMRLCCKIESNRTKPSPEQSLTIADKGGIMVCGGSFGTPITQCCWFQDPVPEHGALPGYGATALIGYDMSAPYWRLPVTLGSLAATHDGEGQLLLLGGWEETRDSVLDTVFSIDIRAACKGMKDSATTAQECYWQTQSSLDKGRCFASATRALNGDVLLMGGGSSPYRGAAVFNDCVVRRFGDNAWLSNCIPSMNKNRCGHSSVTLIDGSILVAGGYAGGFDYLNSAEILSSCRDSWQLTTPMSDARSGFAMGVGPYGAVYVAGGSPDGHRGHRSCERYDAREGKWDVMASMHHGRGYCSGCVGSNGGFYVTGGAANHHFQKGAERYDFRMNIWEEMGGSSTNRSGATHIVGAADDPSEGVVAAAAAMVHAEIQDALENGTGGADEVANLHHEQPLQINDHDEEEVWETEDDDSDVLSDWHSISGEEDEDSILAGGHIFQGYLLRACHQTMYIL